MTIIRTEADRNAYARLIDDRDDWYKAHNIAILSSEQERSDALDALELETDKLYRDLIELRAREVYDNRKARAEAVADKASARYRKGFNTGKSGTTRKQPTKKATVSFVANLLNSLDEGVNA